MPFDPPIGWRPLTYLLRVGFTRDVWMHRIDLARAIGTDPHLTAEHDGRIVADIVAEWADIHREPFALTLHVRPAATSDGETEPRRTPSTPLSSAGSCPDESRVLACWPTRIHFDDTEPRGACVSFDLH